ncbi:MAG: PrsW family intramembrane metalloprotease [Clostridiales bacterium]|nr:PrsW family intramembrane metalloprotease [Clostridiales bacterium]
MLYALALIPVAGLLVFIYFNDKKEKEPFGLLVALFFAGMGTIITAIIGELIGGVVLNLFFPSNTVLGGIFDAMLIVAPAEEMGKFLVLRLITWKNKNFNYSYDAIVYAVFVSLGFAAFENITYVFGSGIGTALLRMFTAVPGHACFAVFMGFFYSKAKYASLTNKKGACAGFTALAMIIPILIHGIYDAILMGGGSSEVAILSGLSLVLWIFFVIALFVVSCILIVKSSRNDFCIVTLPDVGGFVQTIYKPSVIGGWTCSCGSVNQLNFCPKCGNQRPMSTTWYCPVCATPSAFNFCGHCGCPRPAAQNQTYST